MIGKDIQFEERYKSKVYISKVERLKKGFLIQELHHTGLFIHHL